MNITGNFSSFINDELIPFIDKNYRTQPFNILFAILFQVLLHFTFYWQARCFLALPLYPFN
jgi:hypothetical protein